MIAGDLLNSLMGLYIHIPFCLRKCPYCDFYSITDIKLQEKYIDKVCYYIDSWHEKITKKADTLYFGGGTPSIIKAQLLEKVIDKAKSTFLVDKAEITLEVNPATANEQDFYDYFNAGINRISIGMQSANDNELNLLGRMHKNDDTIKAVYMAKKAGFNNISLDLMMGIPDQDENSLKKSIAQCAQLGVQHISAYMLKLEKGTAFYNNPPENIADEDYMCDLYLLTCELLSEYGFNQYEISNWAKKGYESKHNLKYWDCREYLGIGPGAHSFINERRMYYEKNINKFFDNMDVKDDSAGGDKEEYLMLRLRLNEGIKNKLWQDRFNENIPKEYLQRALQLSKNGLVNIDDNGFSLTTKGMLVSNSVIAYITG